MFTKYIKKQDLTPEEKEKLTRNVIDIFKMSAIPVLGISGTTLLGTLTNFLSKGKFSTFPSKFKDKFLPINEYNNTGPTTPEVYIVKADGTYKEVPIEILSKIPNLTYDMGGGETNFYPEKNIVIVDNIPVEQFTQEPGEIKDEKIYVEYNFSSFISPGSWANCSTGILSTITIFL